MTITQLKYALAIAKMETEIVKKYPNAIFLLGHSGGGTPGRFEAIELAQNNDNVYLEFCGSFTTPELFENAIKLRYYNYQSFVMKNNIDAHKEINEIKQLIVGREINSKFEYKARLLWQHFREIIIKK
jgi:hypothetical protein